MPKCAAFVSQGRFGNNVLQYIACKLFCTVTGYEYVETPAQLSRPLLTVFESETDIQWKQRDTDDWVVASDPLSVLNVPASYDVLLHGFYQNLAFINQHFETIRTFLKDSNLDVFYGTTRVCDLFAPATSSTSTSNNTIVIHVRLDDFYHPGKQGSNVLSLDYYDRCFSYLKNFDGEMLERPVWIVSDTLRLKKEKQYVDALRSRLLVHGFCDVQLHQRSCIDDWAMCRNASYFIASNSTFAWTAMIAGQPRVAILPKTDYYSHQVIVPLTHIPHCLVWDAEVVV